MTSRDPQPTTALSARWDRSAPGYDQLCGHGLRTQDERRAWTHLLRRLLPPAEELCVLDAGTGTGFLAVLLAELGHDVTGVDFSEQMLRVARGKAAELPRPPRFVLGDAHDLPHLDDGTFDVVISRHVLWTLPEPERALREWMRISKPGAQIIAVDGLWRGRGPLPRAITAADLLLTRLRQPSRLPDAPAAPLLPLKDLRDPAPAANVFARAGLRAVRAEELAWLDAVERHAMRPRERARHHWHRYLLEGTVPHCHRPT